MAPPIAIANHFGLSITMLSRAEPLAGNSFSPSGKPLDARMRLSVDMPELLEEVVALIERRTAELDERGDGALETL